MAPWGTGTGRYRQENELELKSRLKIQPMSWLETGVAEPSLLGWYKGRANWGLLRGFNNLAGRLRGIKCQARKHH